MIADTAALHINKCASSLFPQRACCPFDCEWVWWHHPIVISPICHLKQIVSAVWPTEHIGAHPKTQMFIGERVRINILFASWIDFCLSSSLSLSLFIFLSPVSEGCTAAVCLNSISHGVSKCYTGESAAQCTEEPALPAAGPRQHVEGAARRDPQVTTAVHRWARPQVDTALLFMLLRKNGVKERRARWRKYHNTFDQINEYWYCDDIVVLTNGALTKHYDIFYKKYIISHVDMITKCMKENNTTARTDW